jgi:hypothetical protein
MVGHGQHRLGMVRYGSTAPQDCPGPQASAWLPGRGTSTASVTIRGAALLGMLSLVEDRGILKLLKELKDSPLPPKNSRPVPCLQTRRG